jgi:hypothetical protein
MQSSSDIARFLSGCNFNDMRPLSSPSVSTASLQWSIEQNLHCSVISCWSAHAASVLIMWYTCLVCFPSVRNSASHDKLRTGRLCTWEKLCVKSEGSSNWTRIILEFSNSDHSQLTPFHRIVLNINNSFIYQVGLGGLMVIVLAVASKVRRFKPSRGRYIFKDDNIHRRRSTAVSPVS